MADSQATPLFGASDDAPPDERARRDATVQRRQEIAAGLRWPSGRRIDYDTDAYFQRRPLALTIPPSSRARP